MVGLRERPFDLVPNPRFLYLSQRGREAVANLQYGLGYAPAGCAVVEIMAAPVVETWSNFRPASPDGEPILGPGAVPGLFYATGHTRNGILLAPITADAIAAALLGQSPPVDLAPFSPARLEKG